MKKTFKYIGVAFITLMVLGNIAKIVMKPSVDNSLKIQVESANRSCPIPVAEGAGQVSAIKLVGKNIVYYLDYKANHFDAEIFNANSEIARDMFYMCLICVKAQEGQENMLHILLNKYNVGLKVVAKDGTGSSFSCEMSPKYMRDMEKKIDMNPSEALHAAMEMQMKMEALELPQTLDEGMVLTQFGLEDNNLVARIEMDEHLYDFDLLESSREEIASNLIDQTNSADHPMAALFDLCKLSHTGIVYRYIGVQTKRVVEIQISSDRIRAGHKTPQSLNIN